MNTANLSSGVSYYGGMTAYLANGDVTWTQTGKVANDLYMGSLLIEDHLPTWCFTQTGSEYWC